MLNNFIKFVINIFIRFKEDTFKKIEEFISLDKEIYEQLLKLGSFNSQNNDHKKLFKSIFQKYS